MHLHFEKVREVGVDALFIAALGTILPIFLGLLFFYILNFPAFPDGLIAGFCLAPTSVGIALQLLSEARKLTSIFGQKIMVAAFIDDLVSIALLIVINSLGEDTTISFTNGSAIVSTFTNDITVINRTLKASPTTIAVKTTPEPLDIILPLIYALIFVSGGALISYKWMDSIMDRLLDCHFLKEYDEDHPERSVSLRDEIHLTVLCLVFTLFSWIGNLIGNFLLGAFVAGVLFCDVSRSNHVWQRQIKRIAKWFIRIFFAATIAFTIDVNVLLSPTTFWQGLVFAIVPCLLAKLCSGIFCPGYEKWVVGVAMMARGEFAYLLAEKAHAASLLDDRGYAVVVWALIWATLISPTIFGYVLKKYCSSTFNTNIDIDLELNSSQSMSIDDEYYQQHETRIDNNHMSGASVTATVKKSVPELVGDTSIFLKNIFDTVVECDESVSSFVFLVSPQQALRTRREIVKEDKIIKRQLLQQSKHQQLQRNNNGIAAAQHSVRGRGSTGGSEGEIQMAAPANIIKKAHNQQRLLSLKMREFVQSSDLTDEKLDELAKELRDASADRMCQVIFEPVESNEPDNLIEIQIVGEHCAKASLEASLLQNVLEELGPDSLELSSGLVGVLQSFKTSNVDTHHAELTIDDPRTKDLAGGIPVSLSQLAKTVTSAPTSGSKWQQQNKNKEEGTGVEQEDEDYTQWREIRFSCHKVSCLDDEGHKLRFSAEDCRNLETSLVTKLDNLQIPHQVEIKYARLT
eukprot:g4015.t1